MIVFEDGAAFDPLHGKGGLDRGDIGPSLRLALAVIPDAKTVGIIAPTGPVLIQAWLACLNCGREPLILQYPTAKLSRTYWLDATRHAVVSAKLDIILYADATCKPEGLDIPTLLLSELESSRAQARTEQFPHAGHVLQMSSGTTGHRKALRLNLDAIRKHLDNYNTVLNLTEGDCIVSWLPLYHDMGFIAGFINPLIIGAKLVLIDPMQWTRRPEMLWEAIERHKGTVCFLPNFAFEVMANYPRPMPTMRLWVSCSEPTRAATLERFAAATQAPPDTLANCWGMAENIFAVCQRKGVRTAEIAGAEVVSCGTPIPGVSVKTIDGELYVKSDYSITKYLHGEPIVDEQGFYPTGDLGSIIDGEIYLQGRKQDVLIHAGRKLVLSDIDFALTELVPEAAGRIASLAVEDPLLGTQTLLVLVEAQKFWRYNRNEKLLRRLMERTGVPTAQVHFVPPRFITKTSSGKINRKITLRHWQSRNSYRQSQLSTDFFTTIRQLFPWLDPARPLGEQIDSLGLVTLNLLAARHGRGGGLNPEQPLTAAFEMRLTASEDEASTVRIASLCDANPFAALALPTLQKVAAQAASTVQITHVCTPPPAVLLSDMIFKDYFLGRDEDVSKYAALCERLDIVQTADVILIDDAWALFWSHSGNEMVYPRISHQFVAHPLASTLGLRWAGYSEQHHEIACELLTEADLTPQLNADALQDLTEYLQVPLVRIAYADDNPEITGEWEVRCGAELLPVVTAWRLDLIDRPQFETDLERSVTAAVTDSCREPSQIAGFVVFQDQPHWCSWMLNPAIADFVVANYVDIVVLGKASSMPYLATQARLKGRRIRYRSDLMVPDDCDCVVQVGSWGRPETDKPLFQFMGAGWLGEPAVNLPPDQAAACPPNRISATIMLELQKLR